MEFYLVAFTYTEATQCFEVDVFLLCLSEFTNLIALSSIFFVTPTCQVPAHPKDVDILFNHILRIQLAPTLLREWVP